MNKDFYIRQVGTKYIQLYYNEELFSEPLNDQQSEWLTALLVFAFLYTPSVKDNNIHLLANPFNATAANSSNVKYHYMEIKEAYEHQEICDADCFSLNPLYRATALTCRHLFSGEHDIIKTTTLAIEIATFMQDIKSSVEEYSSNNQNKGNAAFNHPANDGHKPLCGMYKIFGRYNKRTAYLRKWCILYFLCVIIVSIFLSSSVNAYAGMAYCFSALLLIAMGTMSQSTNEWLERTPFLYGICMILGLSIAIGMLSTAGGLCYKEMYFPAATAAINALLSVYITLGFNS